MCAIGYSGIRFDEAKTDISFNNVKVVKGGLTTHREDKAGKVLKSKEIKITIDLHAGKSHATVLTCDLTEGYIRINAEYRT
jgi:glutamate N-acetyltransferase/amino-acid N-acetyltransferase